MSKVAIVGAGFAGQTAALYLGSALGREHEITVINRSDRFLYYPSLVWVGVGHMKPERTRFALQPVYDRFHVRLVQGEATQVHPDEGYVVAEPSGGGQAVRVDYDYLIVATGAHLNFAGTPGLGPEAGTTYSICTMEHAAHTRDGYLATVERMARGERQRIVIGTGHPGATCQGAAFEYITNVHKDLVKRGLRDRADLLWLSNERHVGDLGVGGVQVRIDGRLTSSEEFLTAIFRDYGIRWEVQKGVRRVEPGRIYWEDYDGVEGESPYDFSMLIPQFTGSPIRYVDGQGQDITGQVANPAGFVKVDATYGLSYEEMHDNPESWPATYQHPTYPNIFAAGIAFAPPGPISAPHVNPNGLSISAAPPRTGMVSGIIGRIVALNVVDLVHGREMGHKERMSEMFAACIASMGDSLWDGAAATVLIHPVVPDPKRFPEGNGRDLSVSHMEMGLAGAWMKRVLHSTFIWKFKGNPGWKIIPE
ncbi:MAG: FAD-dependent oxidoreductase [Anaerolineae bacterium]|jgi:sulfide:quinone oxidoreductase